jgi:endo-1,4-beta-xylanase
MTEQPTVLSRRQFLASAATIAALAAPALGSISDAPKTLREAAAGKGILYGSALRGAGIKDLPFASLFARQCAIVVPEWALEMNSLHATAGQFDFAEGDWIQTFTTSHQMLLRGHSLVWDQALPKWFSSSANRDNAQELLVGHVTAVAAHYAGQMQSWDVVNEAVRIWDGRPDGLKLTPWLTYLGPEYIELAFHVAHQADPAATLVYNETAIEPETSAAAHKRQAVLALLTRLVKRGVPIHGLGVESHLDADANVTGPGFKQFLDAVEDLGLSILITELDVSDHALPENISLRDALVARQYYNYLSFMLQFKSVKTVLTWGLSDRSTWLSKYSPRKDGLPVRPLIYDADLQPKPAFDAVMRAFKEAPRR